MSFASTRWKEIGVFDLETKEYRVKRIPKPPEARALFDRDHEGRKSRLGYELKVACHKCLEQLSVRWNQDYADELADRGKHVLDDIELMAVLVAREMADKARSAETALQRAHERYLRAEAEIERLKSKLVKRSVRRARKERKRRSKNNRPANRSNR